MFPETFHSRNEQKSTNNPGEKVKIFLSEMFEKILCIFSLFVLLFTVVLCNKIVPSSSDDVTDSMSSHQSLYYWPKHHQYSSTSAAAVHHEPGAIHTYDHAEMIPSMTTQKFSRKSSSSLTPSMLMFSTVPSLAVSVLTFPMTLSKFFAFFLIFNCVSTTTKDIFF